MTVTMRPDLRTWVEAGIAYHLKGGVPIDDLPRLMVGRMLAQLLWYFRCDVPGEWADTVSELDFSSLARQMEDRTHLDAGFDDLPACPGDVQSALEKGDWQSLKSVPSSAWEWVARITGLGEGDWESIPSHVRAALESPFICPVCKHAGSVAESARVAYSVDPFDWSSSNVTHLTCRNCGSHLVYDVATSTARLWGQTWSRLRTAVLALIGLGALLFLIAMWRSTG